MKSFAVAYIILAGIMSLVAFVAYGIDKQSAQTGKRRIPERSLHLLALLGGWPGALAGQRVFRHKTRKVSFRVAFWLVVALHLALAGGAAYLLT